MLLVLYIIFQVILIGLFFTAFFTKQELLWSLSTVFSAVLMFSAYNIESYVYEFSIEVGAYVPMIIGNSYPYLMGLNILFFGLSLVLGLFDIFEKYGLTFFTIGNDK